MLLRRQRGVYGGRSQAEAMGQTARPVPPAPGADQSLESMAECMQWPFLGGGGGWVLLGHWQGWGEQGCPVQVGRLLRAAAGAQGGREPLWGSVAPAISGRGDLCLRGNTESLFLSSAIQMLLRGGVGGEDQIRGPSDPQWTPSHWNPPGLSVEQQWTPTRNSHRGLGRFKA